MPSLRKRMSSYFRQLSFHNEPRDKRHNVNENSFITKYLQGQIRLKEGPPIIHGKNPTDLPNYELGAYEIGPDSIRGCYSGPNGGLTTVKRSEKHLSVLDADIDFIDTPAQPPPPNVDDSATSNLSKSPKRQVGQPVDNTTMAIKVAGQEYFVTNRTKQKAHSKSHSLGNVTDFGDPLLPTVEIEKTKIDRRSYQLQQVTPVKADVTVTVPTATKTSFALAKSKSEGNPFRHSTGKKQGKIIKVTERPVPVPKTKDGEPSSRSVVSDDSLLPAEWNKKDGRVFGLSDSLYDRNQVTGNKNGDPIADCFGVISRGDSAILAVADGVNWGEKASIAAKSAVHGCLHYLNKTLFGDTKPFEQLTIKTDESSDIADVSIATQRVGNTRDVFIGLLRAFNCAHDLILENNGMLTTLTVAVILPVKSGEYVCCVCNVGDTLAYVYSQTHGLRELTKGSHDVNCNRDMRDALGALGPVDGINPELSNLTLSVTKIQHGDIVMVASDGLTDNFDPNVCKFTVNSNNTPPVKSNCQNLPPVKPPRKRAVASATTNDSKSAVTVIETKSSSLRRQLSTAGNHGDKSASSHGNNYKFMRSKTSVDMKRQREVTSPSRHAAILRNHDGVPYVTPLQRYELQLLLMEDILTNGISGKDTPTRDARVLCQNLVNYTFSITAAKRHTLEDPDLYFDSRNSGGVMVEVSNQEKKLRRKRGLERVQNLPGKLDHVTVVAWVVGGDSSNVKRDNSSVTPVTTL